MVLGLELGLEYLGDGRRRDRVHFGADVRVDLGRVRVGFRFRVRARVRVGVGVGMRVKVRARVGAMRRPQVDLCPAGDTPALTMAILTTAIY